MQSPPAGLQPAWRPPHGARLFEACRFAHARATSVVVVGVMLLLDYCGVHPSACREPAVVAGVSLLFSCE